MKGKRRNAGKRFERSKLAREQLVDDIELLEDGKKRLKLFSVILGFLLILAVISFIDTISINMFLEKQFSKTSIQLAEQEKENFDLTQTNMQLLDKLVVTENEKEQIEYLQETLSRFQYQLQEKNDLIKNLSTSKAEKKNSAIVSQISQVSQTSKKLINSSGGTIEIKKGDTVWNLMTDYLGHPPTHKQIQKVINSNNLQDFGISENGTWIILIFPGQYVNLNL